ncbi:MAG: AMP-binding protein [Desulfobacterota bacterium]|nr:AMP-binding protein [Thermodesulfobacteriota bacterium]
MNLMSFLESAAMRFPNKTALICAGDRVTYRRLKALAAQYAAIFLSHGLGKGSRVAILANSSVQYIAALFGMIKIGAVCIPLNTRLTASELRLLLSHCLPAALLYDQTSEHLIPELELLPPITLCLERAHRENASAGAQALTSNWDDTAIILYTAGTTGTPKGVVLTHGNLLWNTLNYTAAYCMQPEDIELAPTPLFHAATLGRVFTYVFNAATFILCPRFDAHECLALIEQEQVTSITQVPTMYRQLHEAAQRGCYALQSVKRVVTGAAPMNATTKQQLAELFPAAALYDLYGLTEASPGVTIAGPETFHAKPGSVGRPMLTVRIGIVDDQDTPVGHETVGEIVCRGPNIMQGYYRDPEATAAALRGGWLHTGDKGFIDRDGCLHIIARKKEIIISGGVNIYPGEIEQVLCQHPDIVDAAVVGIPDERWGERVVAAVVVRSGTTITHDDILRQCRQHLAGFKCPKEIFFLDTLPRNAAQKLLRHEVVQHIERMRSANFSP